MAQTARDIVKRVLKECGGPLGRPVQDPFMKDLLAELAAWVPILWEMESAQPTWRLRFLYTKAGAIDFLRGQFWPDTDAQVGPRGIKVADSQIFKALTQMAQDNRAEIARTEKALTASGSGVDGAGGPSAGTLDASAGTATATAGPAGTSPDDFAGDPLADPGSGGLDWL